MHFYKKKEESNSNNEYIKMIEEIKSDEINNVCFECGSSSPEFISINNGVFLCKECVQNHFNFPKEISTIIINDLCSLNSNEVKKLYLGGNKKLIEFINFDYPSLKQFPPNILYKTRAIDYYRKRLDFYIVGGIKPLKPLFESAYQLINSNSNINLNNNLNNRKDLFMSPKINISTEKIFNTTELTPILEGNQLEDENNCSTISVNKGEEEPNKEQKKNIIPLSESITKNESTFIYSPQKPRTLNGNNSAIISSNSSINNDSSRNNKNNSKVITYKKHVVNNSFKTDKNINQSLNNINEEMNIIPERIMSRNFSDINLPESSSNLNINNERNNINLNDENFGDDNTIRIIDGCMNLSPENDSSSCNVRNIKENNDSIQLTSNRDKNEDTNDANAKIDDLKIKRENEQSSRSIKFSISTLENLNDKSNKENNSQKEEKSKKSTIINDKNNSEENIEDSDKNIFKKDKKKHKKEKEIDNSEDNNEENNNHIKVNKKEDKEKNVIKKNVSRNNNKAVDKNSEDSDDEENKNENKLKNKTMNEIKHKKNNTTYISKTHKIEYDDSDSDEYESSESEEVIEGNIKSEKKAKNKTFVKSYNTKTHNQTTKENKSIKPITHKKIENMKKGKSTLGSSKKYKRTKKVLIEEEAEEEEEEEEEEENEKHKNKNTKKVKYITPKEKDASKYSQKRTKKLNHTEDKVKKAKKENKTNKPVKHLKANISTQRSFDDYEEDEYEDEFVSKESKRTHTVINKNGGTKKEKYFKEVLNKKGKSDNFFDNNDSQDGDINPLKYFKKSFRKIQEEKFVFGDEDEEEEEEEEEDDKKCKSKKIIKVVKEKVVPKKVKKNGVFEILDSDSDDFYEKYDGLKNKNIIASNKKVKTKKIIYYDNFDDDEDEFENEKKVKKTKKNNDKSYKTNAKRVKKKIVKEDDDESEENSEDEKENKKTVVKRKYKTHK